MLKQNPARARHASAEGHIELPDPAWLDTFLPKMKPYNALMHLMPGTHQDHTSWLVQGSRALAARKAAALAAQQAAALAAAQPVSSAARPVPASAPRVSTCTFIPPVCFCLTGMHFDMGCSLQIRLVSCRYALSNAGTGALLSDKDS